MQRAGGEVDESADTELALFRSTCDASLRFRRKSQFVILEEWIRLHDCCKLFHQMEKMFSREVLCDWREVVALAKKRRRCDFFATQKYFHLYWRLIFGLLWENRVRRVEIGRLTCVAMGDSITKKRVWSMWTGEARPRMLEERRLFEVKFVMMRYFRVWRVFSSREERMDRYEYILKQFKRKQRLFSHFGEWIEIHDKRNRLQRMTGTGLMLLSMSRWLLAAVHCRELKDFEEKQTRRIQFLRFKKTCDRRIAMKKVFSDFQCISYMKHWMLFVEAQKVVHFYRKRVMYRLISSKFHLWMETYSCEKRVKNTIYQTRLELVRKLMLGWNNCTQQRKSLRKLSKNTALFAWFRDWYFSMMKAKKSKAVSRLVSVLDLLRRFYSLHVDLIFRASIKCLVKWREIANVKKQANIKVREILAKVEIIKRNLLLLSN